MTKYIDLVKNSPKLVGLKQVLAGIIDGTVRCVLVSYDSDEFVKKAISEAVVGKDIRQVALYSKRQLGKMCGIDVPASVVGITEDSRL